MSDSALSWPEFLGSRGALPAPAGSPDLLTFTMPDSPHAGLLCALTHLGVISATGEDAANFLHNQLTNDVLGLDATHAHLAGYCSPKGRLLATMLVCKQDDEFLLVMPRDVLPATLRRLQMFVMRSRLKLQDASARMVLLGMAAAPGQLASLPDHAWQCMRSDGGTLIRMPDAAGWQRALWAGNTEQAVAAWDVHSSSLQPAPASLWRWTDIMAGLPQVVDATREQFVPQMINFELVGGVNFRKGCYPGQEIVARSQYLGKLKRRMLLAFADKAASAAEIAAGTEVFSAADPEQPCGMIVNAESGPDARIACLVELKMELAGTSIHIGSTTGPLLQLGDLPYSLSAAE